MLCSLKILLLLAQTRSWRVLFGDVSTAFLHARLQDDERIFVEPPIEYDPQEKYKTSKDPKNSVLWRLRKALYGLRTAPKQWQDHFAVILEDLGGARLKSDPNVYYFAVSGCYLMVYVDDLILLGEDPDALFEKIEKQVLLKKIGVLTEGVTTKFLGRKIQMKEGTIELFMSPNYVLDILEEHGLRDAKSVVSPGLQSVTTPDAVSALEGKSVSLYRRGVGKCMWMVPLRTEIYYTTKELARNL